MQASLKRATRKQLIDFMVDCLGYDEDSLDDYTCEDMQGVIYDFEIADKQGDQFAGYTY